MNQKFRSRRLIIIVIVLSFLAVYLQKSYARIYNRQEPNISALSWYSPINIKNSNFQNTVKYVAIGDSLTFGVGSNDMKKTLPYIFADKVSKQMSVTFVNLAVTGATTNNVIYNQLSETKLQKPNYVTIFIGINDLHSLTSPLTFKMNMDYIINFLKEQTQAKIIMFNIPYLGSNNLVLFPYNVLIDYQTNQYNKILKDISKQNNITLIDIYTPTKNNFSKQSNFYSSDNFHPSAQGYVLWGSLIGPEDF